MQEGIVRETTKTPKTPLKVLQASTGEMGETEQIRTVFWVLNQSKLYGRAAKRKPLLTKTKGTQTAPTSTKTPGSRSPPKLIHLFFVTLTFP